MQKKMIFYQWAVCIAPIHWSKYTTNIIQYLKHVCLTFCRFVVGLCKQKLGLIDTWTRQKYDKNNFLFHPSSWLQPWISKRLECKHCFSKKTLISLHISYSAKTCKVLLSRPHCNKSKNDALVHLTCGICRRSIVSIIYTFIFG